MSLQDDFGAFLLLVLIVTSGIWPMLIYMWTEWYSEKATYVITFCVFLAYECALWKMFHVSWLCALFFVYHFLNAISLMISTYYT